jgi:hypothetical protein
MPAQQTYTTEEIKHWKALIYGGMNSDIKGQDNWVSSEQDSYTKSPGARGSYRRSGSGRRSISKSTSSTPTQRYTENDWLTGDSPCGTKRSYRSKATKEIGKPGVF